jgi:hypothetical protein
VSTSSAVGAPNTALLHSLPGPSPSPPQSHAASTHLDATAAPAVVAAAAGALASPRGAAAGPHAPGHGHLHLALAAPTRAAAGPPLPQRHLPRAVGCPPGGAALDVFLGWAARPALGRAMAATRLPAVTCVAFSNVTLPCLVPPPLAACCPALATLRLGAGVAITAQHPLHPAPRLRTLELALGPGPGPHSSASACLGSGVSRSRPRQRLWQLLQQAAHAPGAAGPASAAQGRSLAVPHTEAELRAALPGLRALLGSADSRVPVVMLQVSRPVVHCALSCASASCLHSVHKGQAKC